MKYEKFKLEWQELKYGMFIHYGPNTFENKIWGDGKFDINNFNPTNLEQNIVKWVEVAKENSMKYLVITAKHHDGFCLWNTKYSDYNSCKSPANIDIVSILARECKKLGIKLGIYYSLWDLHYQEYSNDDKYFDYMTDQLEELLTNYGDVLCIWFDGAWDKDYPESTWVFNQSWELGKTKDYTAGERWKFEKVYEHIKRLQPNCCVINNSGYDRPGIIKYLPIDIRTSERFNYVHEGHFVHADKKNTQEFENETYYLPLEYVLSMNPNWFNTGGSSYIQATSKSIFEIYELATSNKNNLLLNVGPDKNGEIIACEIECLNEINQLIKEQTCE